MQRNGIHYVQIANFYRAQLEGGQLGEGAKMPTETQICSLFNVSRITVRQAMSQLEQAGYITRMQGKGSFVRVKKTNMQLNHLQGFTEEMRAKGMAAESVLISASIEKCEQTAAKSLKIAPGAPVISIERLRLADHIPMAVEHVYIPFFHCPDLLQRDLSSSLYSILQNDYHYRIVSASQDIEAGIAPRSICDMLQVRPNIPSLIIKRISYMENDMPLEYVVSVYRSDRYTFHVEMLRDNG
jgi:GntR family transcriptional regulator